MKKRIFILILFTSASLFSFASSKDVYIVFYATLQGKTGHIGIAVDQYRIVFRDTIIRKKTIQLADTIISGRLTYYDLWPNEDSFSSARTAIDIPAHYYKLPVSSTEGEITVNSLYDKGIPHKENYPCDGLLKIKTSWQEDQYMIALLDSMVTANRSFNGQKFNCTDFVKYPLERLLDKTIDCKEFILAGWSNTPNKFYLALRKLQEVEIIKNADNKAQGSFIQERIIFPRITRSKPD